jgi:hypothetical protein
MRAPFDNKRTNEAIQHPTNNERKKTLAYLARIKIGTDRAQRFGIGQHLPSRIEQSNDFGQGSLVTDLSMTSVVASCSAGDSANLASSLFRCERLQPSNRQTNRQRECVRRWLERETDRQLLNGPPRRAHHSSSTCRW